MGDRRLSHEAATLDQVRRTLDRCLQFDQIQRSGHLSRFLTFVVEQKLAGTHSQITETSIAVEALGRGDDFDPRLDPVVRVVAGRLRRALQMYALTDGRDDLVRIDLPRGSYVPRFERNGDRTETARKDGGVPDGRDQASISVVLIDDHAMLRRGLRVLLDAEQDLHVVGEAGDGAEALNVAKIHRPDVVVMDISMPGVDGVEATRRLRSQRPEIGVIALSVHAGQRFVGDMLRAGARGYVLKESAPEELVTAIRAVVRGETYLSPIVMGAVVSQFVASRPESSAAPKSLTDEQRALLGLLAAGRSDRELADHLRTTPQDIATVIDDLIRQLDLGSVEELMSYAESAQRPR